MEALFSLARDSALRCLVYLARAILARCFYIILSSLAFITSFIVLIFNAVLLNKSSIKALMLTSYLKTFRNYRKTTLQ